MSLLHFWFTFMRPYWFGCPASIDDLIKTKYKTLLQDTVANLPTEPSIELIILFDQIPRHIYRDNKAAIKQYDAVALNYAKQLSLNELDPEQRCFALLPYRHTFEMPNLQYCLQTISTFYQTNPHPMYKRFLQATLKAIANINNVDDLLYISDGIYDTQILDKSSPSGSTIIIPQSTAPLCAIFKKYIDLESPIIISVSGGVDSMVSLLCAYSLGLSVIAVSIDYGNRPEQAEEIKMVNNVCNVLGIKHYVRRITEIQRPHQTQANKNEWVTRDFYETFTRDIRFDTYKKIIELTGAQGVVLGHNQDDTLENVFSNIKKRKGYNNLFGMTHNSEERGVTILRPLLDVQKTDIIAFAQSNGIPYTYDSTPTWSERGQMRDKLIPAIKNFDESLLPGLIDLVKNYNQIYSIYSRSLPTIQYAVDHCTFNLANNYLYDYVKKIFTQIALHYGVPFAKNKSIIHLCEQLQNGNASRLTVSKNMVMQRHESCVVYLYKS